MASTNSEPRTGRMDGLRPSGESSVQVETLLSTLQVTAEISRLPGATSSPDELMNTAVDLIRRRFDFDYTGLFLVDSSGGWAVLRAGSGEAGGREQERDHKVEIGDKSAIGWCIANGRPRIALDIAPDIEQEAPGSDKSVLRKPRSEMALPMTSRDQVIGALAIQSDRAAAFSEEDVTILQSLADHLAAALENARLLNELRETQARLDRGHSLLQTLLEHIPDRIYFKDRKGRYLQASKTLATSFGLEDAALVIGKTDFDFFTPEEAQRAHDDEQRILQSGQPIHNQIERERGPGRSEAWTMTTKLPLYNRDGEIVGTFGISRDITEIKRAQELAERQASQLRTAAEIARDTSGTLELDELLQRVVNLVRDRFGFYHASIFLLDGRGEFAVVRAATGTAGAEMVRRGYKLATGSRSVVGAVAATGATRVLNDVMSDPTYRSNRLLPETRAEVGVPLKIGTRILGVLDVRSAHPHAFGEVEVQVLETLAGQIAVAVENSRLFTQTQASLDELESLNSFSQAVSAASRIEDLFQVIHDQVRLLIGETHFEIALYDAKSGLIEIPYHYENGQRTSIEPFPFGQGLTSVVIRTRRPLLLAENAEKQVRSLGAQMTGKVAQSWLGVPLVVAGDVIGVMAVQDPEHEHRFGEEHVRLLSTMATPAAGAIYNARLLEATRRQAEREQLIRAIMGKIRNSNDPRTILQVTARELSHVLGASHATVRLGITDREPTANGAEP